MKLVPSGDKLEIRVRGPNITPGYWKRPDLTAAAFDEEGFYKPGDAVRFADPADPRQGRDVRRPARRGLQADHRHLGACRGACASACSPPARRCCRTRSSRARTANSSRCSSWLNAAGCQKLIGARRAGRPRRDLARHPAVREHVRRALARWNAAHPGSSERIARVLLLPDAPSIDANEITDKGYINQRLALERRAAEVARLFAAHAGCGCDRRADLELIAFSARACALVRALRSRRTRPASAHRARARASACRRHRRAGRAAHSIAGRDDDRACRPQPARAAREIERHRASPAGGHRRTSARRRRPRGQERRAPPRRPRTRRRAARSPPAARRQARADPGSSSTISATGALLRKMFGHGNP